MTGRESPVGVVDDSLHELVGHANRVVGVLVLDRGDVLTVEVHVEAGVAQDAGLLLLTGLAPNELLNVRVVHVEDDHFGGATGLAARLDGAGRGVGATHERDGATGGAAAFEDLGARADTREVDTGTRTTLEDDSLFGVPVENRLHRVLDSEDETGTALLGHATHTDVEPHRGVEGGLLGHEQVLELCAEGLGLGLVGEVVTLDAPSGDGVGDTVDDLLEAPLALRRAEGAAEVLLGEDVRRVHRPVRRDLDPELLKGNRPVAEVSDARVATIPDDLVVRVAIRGGEEPADADSKSLGCDSHDCFLLDTPTLQPSFCVGEVGKTRLIVRDSPATTCSGFPTPGRKML